MRVESDQATGQQDWKWVGRYIAVIVVALVLAAAIGSMALFAKTWIVAGKLSAAQLVRFLGYGTALGALWMLGQRATVALQHAGGRWSFLQHLLLPVVTLVVVSAAYSVALLVLKPVMDASLSGIYDWVFIVAIVGCAVWVVMAVLGQSASMTEAFTSAARRPAGASVDKICVSCGAINEAGANFCKACATALPSQE